MHPPPLLRVLPHQPVCWPQKYYHNASTNQTSSVEPPQGVRARLVENLTAAELEATTPRAGFTPRPRPDPTRKPATAPPTAPAAATPAVAPAAGPVVAVAAAAASNLAAGPSRAWPTGLRKIGSGLAALLAALLLATALRRLWRWLLLRRLLRFFALRGRVGQ